MGRADARRWQGPSGRVGRWQVRAAVTTVLAAMAATAATALAFAGSGATQSAAPLGFVGMVSPDTFARNASYRDSQLAMMRGAGVTLVRQVFDWSTIEARRGVFDFSAYDSLVASAAQHGIEIMPVLFNPPAYLSARPAGTHQHGTYPPADPASVEAFAAAAVRWYGPGGGFWAANPSIPQMPIEVWQIWDEPNLPVYWLPSPNAGEYAALLRDASRAIHRVDSSAEVVSAGLPQSALGVPLLSYLRSLLGAGAAGSIDSLGVNAYSNDESDMMTLLRQVRSTLDAGGASDVAIRVTEFGWADSGPDGHFSLTPAGQATQIGTAVRDFGAARSSLDLRGFVYFDWRDAAPYPGGVDFWGLHTGLLTLHGQPKPALAAFSQAANSLSQPQPPDEHAPARREQR